MDDPFRREWWSARRAALFVGLFILIGPSVGSVNVASVAGAIPVALVVTWVLVSGFGRIGNRRSFFR